MYIFIDAPHLFTPIFCRCIWYYRRRIDNQLIRYYGGGY